MTALEFALELVKARARRRKSDIRPIVRVLAIKSGQKKDADGRGVGDDWLLASFGADADGTEYYLTTDRVHASEMMAIDDGLGPGQLAQRLAKAINAAWRRRAEKGRRR